MQLVSPKSINTKLLKLGAMHLRSHKTMRNTSRAHTYACVRAICALTTLGLIWERASALCLVLHQVQCVEEDPIDPGVKVRAFFFI